MSANEVLVVIVFGYIGYLIVSIFISFVMKKIGAKSTPYASSSSSSESQSQNRHDYQKKTINHDGDDISISWFRILDVPKTASLEIIKSAYKRQISQYHPDKVASMGLELKELAELKTKRINAAYDYASKLWR